MMTIQEEINMGLITDCLFEEQENEKENLYKKIKHLQQQVLDCQNRYNASLEVLKNFEKQPTRLIEHTLANMEARILKGKSRRAHLRQLSKAYQKLFKDNTAIAKSEQEWRVKYFKLRDAK